MTATVCSRSGKLPIAGLCDGTLRSEYFAEGTVPSATCDVHYAGQICQYTGLPATEFCPFKAEGVVELTPIEDISLQSGSATVSQVVDPDGTVNNVATPAAQTNLCPHNAEFYADPNYEAVIAMQRMELEQRTQQAILEAQQAALAQQQQQAAEQPQPPADVPPTE